VFRVAGDEIAAFPIKDVWQESAIEIGEFVLKK
jgi:hypothetical protein